MQIPGCAQINATWGGRRSRREETAPPPLDPGCPSNNCRGCIGMGCTFQLILDLLPFAGRACAPNRQHCFVHCKWPGVCVACVLVEACGGPQVEQDWSSHASGMPSPSSAQGACSRLCAPSGSSLHLPACKHTLLAHQVQFQGRTRPRDGRNHAPL